MNLETQLPLDVVPAAERRSWSQPALFWRVFAVNASLLTLAAVLLLSTPITLSYPVTSRQAALLVGGVVVLLAVNYVLLSISVRLPDSPINVDDAHDERLRLAVELHDEVGQGLTAALLQLQAGIAAVPEPLQPQLLEAQRLTHGTLDEIRRIARALRPAPLDDLGLAGALQVLADSAAATGGFSVERQVTDEPLVLDDATELALYRIAQESLANVIRHAAAATVQLVLGVDAGGSSLILSTADDGRGMVYTQKLDHGGIRGMRERAASVGGTLTIESVPGRGTRVNVGVPLPGR